MKMTQNGINQLLKAHEGLRLRAYDDLQPNKTITNILQVIGTLTNGYGHTGSDVFVGQLINEQKANEWLSVDMLDAENKVKKMVRVAITANMNDALLDLAYNTGGGNMPNSRLIQKLNASDYKGAADEFLRWNTSKGVVIAGLTVRCQHRRELFLTGLGVNTYYAPDGSSYKPDTSSTILKLIAVASAVGSF